MDPTAAGRALAPEDRRHLRGSVLLLAGRALSMALNLVTQVLLVRHLSKAGFGSFAYGLAIAAAAEPLLTLGMHRSTSRHLAVYDERGDRERFAGTLVLAAGVVLALGAVAVLVAALVARSSPAGAAALLGILVLLAPIDALDGVAESCFAALGRVREVALRKHVLAPILRLAVVAGAMAAGAGPRGLAVAWVAAAAGGTLLYAGRLVAVLRERGVLQLLRPGRATVPAREVLPESLPLLSTDLVYVALDAAPTILLGAAGAAAVAPYRAAVTPARLNHRLVTSAVGPLYTPLAARLHERGDRPALHRHYWRTATWIAVLTAPVLLATVPLAGATAIALFGSRYADAAPVLALLAAAWYVNAAVGFDGVTLQVVGAARSLLKVNAGAAAVQVAASVLLIPILGPVGAAAAVALTLAAQNAALLALLPRRAGIGLVDRGFLRSVGLVAAACVAVWLFDVAVAPPYLVSLGVAALASLALVVATRSDLALAEVAPELRRLPVLGRLLVGDAPSEDPHAEGMGPDGGGKGRTGAPVIGAGATEEA